MPEQCIRSGQRVRQVRLIMQKWAERDKVFPVSRVILCRQSLAGSSAMLRNEIVSRLLRSAGKQRCGQDYCDGQNVRSHARCLRKAR